jgi:phage-related minor tail protein
MNDPTLHQDVGHLEGKLESLEKSVEKLTDRVEDLTAVLNQGRGAKWAALALFGLFASAVSGLTAVLTFFGLRLTFGGS